MSYKPDESVLISWLYGELDGAEKAKVEQYLQENPEKLREMQQLRDVSHLMGNIRDKEVIAPPLFMDDNAKTVAFWRTNSFKTIMSIAASFLVLIVAARLLNVDARYSNGELRISFGQHPAGPSLEQVQHDPVDTGLTAADVQRMIDQSNQKSRQELDEVIKSSFAINTGQIRELVKQASSASQEDVRNFVSTLQREHLAQMKDYLALSVSDQRKYTDNLIVEFSRFLQEQRTQDLNMYQARFSRIEQNTDQLKSETEQILASLILNSPQGTQSSY